MTEIRRTAILIFPSIHHVLRAEKILKRSGQEFDLVPVPKEVNPDCGMAVETAPENAELVGAVLAQAGLIPEAVYLRQGGEFTRTG